MGNIWWPATFTARSLYLSKYPVFCADFNFNSIISFAAKLRYFTQLLSIKPNFLNISFSLDLILNPVVELLSSDYNKPKQIHTLESGAQISSLATTDKFLIIGSVNEITGFNWKEIPSSKLCKPAWVIKIPSQSYIEQCDVNSVWLSDDQETLYVGCGDNNIYVYNLEERRLLCTYKGHSDYIHSVHGK